MLKAAEIVVILSILALFVEDFIASSRRNAWYSLYSPTIVLGGLILYYTILGPVQSLFINGDVLMNGVDHRDYLFSGWFAVFIYYLFVRLGYSCPSVTTSPYINTTSAVPSTYIYKVGFYLFFAGIMLYLSTISFDLIITQLNPFDSVDSDGSTSSAMIESGSFKNYFLYSINLAIPGLALMFSSLLRQRKGYILFSLSLLVTTLLFLTEGFRYRIAILLMSLLVLWLFRYKKKLPILLISIFLFFFIFVSSLIGAIRVYGSGLDLTKVQDFSPTELAQGKGLGEDKVFLATAAIVDQTPSLIPYVGLTPIQNLILFPIPRSILPDKPDASYVKDSLEKIYGNAAYSAGVAFLNIGEYFLVAGWFSLVPAAFITGYFLKKLWHWFLLRSSEPLAQCAYLIHCAFLLMLLSRGYIAQVAMLYVFTVFPSLLIYYRLSRRVKNVRFSQ